MYTEFKGSKDKPMREIICSYCGKILVDLKKDWSFGIFLNPIIKSMIEKDELICDCESAKLELKYKKEILVKKHEIDILEAKIGSLIEEEDLPF